MSKIKLGRQRQKDGHDRREKLKNVLDNTFLYSGFVSVCENMHHMSIFITLSETALFSHLRVQSLSLSLLSRCSHRGIIA